MALSIAETNVASPKSVFVPNARGAVFAETMRFPGSCLLIHAAESVTDIKEPCHRNHLSQYISNNFRQQIFMKKHFDHEI